MTDRKNGQDTQHRAPPSNGSNGAAITMTFARVAGAPGALARQSDEWQRADASRLQKAREAGAEDERRWLARELHDSVSPVLYSIALLASAARAQLQPDQEKASSALDLALSLAQAQVHETRQLVAFMLADSLVEALFAAADFTTDYGGVEVARELCSEPALAVFVKVGLYKIAREAMHNAVKHAPGCRMAVRLEQRDRQLVLDVSDEGPGFDSTAVPPGHFGLISMRERAASIGATIDIRSAPGPGTRVRVAVPLAS